ncbi:MAG: cytochrome c [Pseudomonadota bacterium]
MLKTIRRFSVFFAAIAVLSPTFAADDPIEKRHELMEDVGKAAKPVGLMLRGDSEYDWAVVLTSLNTFEGASKHFGDLFPAGSETGGDTEAAPAIWDDREGFDEALAMWRDATQDAIAAQPQTLDTARPVLGGVFKTCKNCHDGYRIEDE